MKKKVLKKKKKKKPFNQFFKVKNISYRIKKSLP